MSESFELGAVGEEKKKQQLSSTLLNLVAGAYDLNWQETITGEKIVYLSMQFTYIQLSIE